MRDTGSSARQGWFAHLLRSSYFAPLTLAVIAVLIVGIVVQLLALAGAFPRSRAAQNRVVITGPGRTGNGDQIQSYVLGAVVSPGVYALPLGSRVHDLVAAAGGATADADLARVSLAGRAGRWWDGLCSARGRIHSADARRQVEHQYGQRARFPLCLGYQRRHCATQCGLVAYRTAHGPFTAISQLLLVPISQTTYDRIRLLVTV